MHVLIVEYLHAQSEAYGLASESMLAEGRKMLTAVLEDLGRHDEITGTVALCRPAVEQFSHPCASILNVSTGPESDFEEQLLVACADARGFDKVLLIAPECGGLLTRITRRLRHRNYNVVGPDLQTITLCADKFSTIQFLERHRIPCLPTQSLIRFAQLQTAADANVVLKPRDGAGCEDVVQLPAAQLNSQIPALGTHKPTPNESPCSTDVSTDVSASEIPLYLDSPNDFIVQPFLKGTSLSIGIIGRGEAQSALVLPVASQNIEWCDGRPAYRGGCIPARVSNEVNQRALEIAEKIAVALNIQHGYVGIDLLVQSNTQNVFVAEINPRMCTSYVGYRNFASSNLLEVLLQHGDSQEITWRKTSVTFTV